MQDLQNKPQATDEEKEHPQAELISSWSGRLEKFVGQHDKTNKEKITQLRKLVSSEKDDDDTIRLIHATFATLLPQIYAKNPEITCTPEESASPERYEVLREFCKGLRIVLNRLLIDDAEMKKKAKAAIRSAFVTGIGWVKVLYQRDYKSDPIILDRIKDEQDNVARLDAMLLGLDDPAECEDIELQRQKIQQAIETLNAQVEVVAAEGFVIDRPLTEDIIILDDSIKDFDDYTRAQAIAHRVWMTKDDYKARFGHAVPDTVSKHKEDAESKEAAMIPVYEIWSQDDNCVFTLCIGAKKWARDPYTPERLGERFYPFFGLAFNQRDGAFMPISDTELLKSAQEEYNDIRTKQKEVREDNRPGMAYRRGAGIDQDDIENIQNRKTGDMIGVGGDSDRPLSTDLVEIPTPRYDHAMYDVTSALRDVEQLSGASDASRNIVHNTKTATEAEIMANAMHSRSGDRIDIVEDWLTEISNFGAQVALLELEQVQVHQIAGQVPWPNAQKEEVYTMFTVQIRGGSTTKPNKMREQQQWADAMPILEGMLMKYAQLRSAGNPMADTVKRLMEITVERFDEKIDIDELLPDIQIPAAPLPIDQQSM